MTNKMRIIAISAATAISFLFFVNCGENGFKPVEERCFNEKQSVFQPETEGSWWEYHMEYLSSEDTVRLIINENAVLEIGGNILYSYSMDFDNNQGNAKFYRRNSAEGVYFVGGISEEDTLLIDVIEYKYPCNPGDTWEVPKIYAGPDHMFYIRDTVTYECVDTNIQVITPLDTFKTVLYSHFIPPPPDVADGDFSFDYYCPGIGLVKNELRGEGTLDLIGSIVLIDFCLKK